MAPLMCLNRDEIAEASLQVPTDEEPRTSPIPEEKATLLGEELEPQEAQEATASPHECLGTPNPKKPIKQFDALSTHAPLSMTLTPHGDPSQKTMRSWQRTELQSPPTPGQSDASKWVWVYIEKNGDIPDWW